MPILQAKSLERQNNFKMHPEAVPCSLVRLLDIEIHVKRPTTTATCSLIGMCSNQGSGGKPRKRKARRTAATPRKSLKVGVEGPTVTPEPSPGGKKDGKKPSDRAPGKVASERLDARLEAAAATATVMAGDGVATAGTRVLEEAFTEIEPAGALNDDDDDATDTEDDADFLQAPCAALADARGRLAYTVRRPTFCDRGDAAVVASLVRTWGGALAKAATPLLFEAAARPWLAGVTLLLATGARADVRVVRAGQRRTWQACLSSRAPLPRLSPACSRTRCSHRRRPRAHKGADRPFHDASAGEGLMPLHVAAAYDNVDACAALLDAGADAGDVDVELGRNALHFAATNDACDALAFLLDRLGERGEALLAANSSIGAVAKTASTAARALLAARDDWPRGPSVSPQVPRRLRTCVASSRSYERITYAPTQALAEERHRQRRDKDASQGSAV